MTSAADENSATGAGAVTSETGEAGAAKGGAGGRKAMIKSELIQTLAQQQNHLNARDVELAVKTIIEQMTLALSKGKRIELRGFGSFSLHRRPERQGRNPMTGETVHLPVNYVPHFKPGKILRWRVDLPENKNKNRDPGQDK